MLMSKEVFNMELTKIKKGATFQGQWKLNFKVSKEYASGMPWESEEDKKGNQSSGFSKTEYIIQVSSKDASRMEGLLREAKERKV